MRSLTIRRMAISPITAKGRHDAKTHRGDRLGVCGRLDSQQTRAVRHDPDIGRAERVAEPLNRGDSSGNAPGLVRTGELHRSPEHECPRHPEAAALQGREDGDQPDGTIGNRVEKTQDAEGDDRHPEGDHRPIEPLRQTADHDGHDRPADGRTGGDVSGGQRGNAVDGRHQERPECRDGDGRHAHRQDHEHRGAGGPPRIERAAREKPGVAGVPVQPQKGDQTEQAGCERRNRSRDRHLDATEGDQNDAETQQRQTPDGEHGSLGRGWCHARAASQDDPEGQRERLAGEEGEAPAPGRGLHEEPADERPGEGRDAPDGRNGRHRTCGIAAREDQPDRDEAHRHQTTSADTLQGATSQEQDHARADGTEETADPEQAGGRAHRPAQAEPHGQQGGGRSRDDRADLVERDGPTHQGGPADLRHDGWEHGGDDQAVGRVQPDRQADQGQRSGVGTCQKLPP
nr:hypothetical protein [Aquibium microcysteis]